MARKASSSSVQSRKKFDWRKWTQDNPQETRVALITAAVAFFFTQGLPLVDSDTGNWFAQSHQGWGALLSHVLLPFTSAPQSWGYADRPLQALLYKVYITIFGASSFGAFVWYFVKSSVFGVLCGGLWHWMKRMNLDRAAMTAALTLFVASANVITSLVWHSDWSVYSELVLVGVLFWSLREIENGPASKNVYKKGWAGLPVAFKSFLITFFLSVYFGSKIKGDVQFAPLILLSWMWFFRREKFQVYWMPFTVTFALTLPWSADFFKHLPPFVPGSTGFQGTTYAQMGFSQILNTLGANLFSFDFSTGTGSWLAASGIVILASVAVYAIYRASQEKLETPDEHWGFHLIWLAFALLGCAALSPNSTDYSLRFFIVPLVPTTILLAMTLHSAIHDFVKFPQMRRVVVAIVAVQCAFNLVHAYEIRKDLGHAVAAVDQLHRAVEQNYAQGQFVYGPGFRDYGYESSSKVIAERKSAGTYDEVHQMPANQTYVATWEPTLDPSLTIEGNYNGCGSSIFDIIAPCGAGTGAHLMRFLGQVPEVVQASQMESQGNIAGARQALESYYQKDRNNPGVAFMIGLDAYKVGDHGRMEQIYDTIGPMFWGNVSVVYNWALSKQGAQKYTEAAKLFERAYEMAPKDYAIGYNLADTYYREGRKSRALATLNNMLQFYPNNPAMMQSLQDWQKQ